MNDADILHALEREASRAGTISAGALSLRLPDPSQGSISFSVGSGTILTMTPDGKIERGPGLSDDEATAAFLECLSQHCPTFLMELRQRTERAEADLEQAKCHIEVLTAFFMDNVNWVRASNEARAFVRGLPKLTDARGCTPDNTYAGVSG